MPIENVFAIMKRLEAALTKSVQGLVRCYLEDMCTSMWRSQALTGTRYPTLPGFNFYYPYPTRKFFENFRVQGSNYTCCFHTGLYQ